MLIFLDIDGVMRRTNSPPRRFDADCLACFERTLAALPPCEIVITSSWREVVPLAEIRALFSSAAGARIIGAVPIIDAGARFPRHREVIEFLSRSGREPEFWIGIDDDVLAYPNGCRVVLTDPARGFDAAAARRLAMVAREGSD